MEKITQTISKEPFGMTRDGVAVDIYSIKNSTGAEVRISNYGGIVVSLSVPDRKGTLEDVVLGFDSLEGYLGEHPYFGAIIGRFGNRIGEGRFTLDGIEYKLAKNNGPNHLHGGIRGFDKVVWKAEEIKTPEGLGIRLSYLSPDGEEGYPGNLDLTVSYVWTTDGSLRISYKATTDKPTVINLTNHSYFNLAGNCEKDILEHSVTINADRFTPVNDKLIPTGELSSVAGTPFDFRHSHLIGERIGSDNEQLIFGGGYDHNWVISGESGGIRLAATAYDKASGRVLETYTTEPGMQMYTGNFLDGSIVGKAGRVYGQRSGLCFETQHFPDSPNKAQFPTTILRPGEAYDSHTIYSFMAE